MSHLYICAESANNFHCFMGVLSPSLYDPYHLTDGKLTCSYIHIMIYFRLFHPPTFTTTLRSTVNSEVDFLSLFFFLSFFFHLQVQDGDNHQCASDSCDFLSCIYSSKIPSRTLNTSNMTIYNSNESITSPSLDKGKYTSSFQRYIVKYRF